MCAAFKAYFEKIEALTNKELDRSAVELVAVESRNVALVIAHLSEISRRKAELEHGYRSLFDYGVRRLGLSEGSVALRIQVANVSRRFPQILAVLAEGRISLSVAGRLSPHLREDNVETLLADCAGMTKRAVEEYLVRLKPKPLFEPSIRKFPCDQECPAPERLAEVLGIENPAENMAEILEKALGLALEAKDPERRLERRLERKRRQDEAALRSQSASRESRPGEIASREPATSRHVPDAVRDGVFQRAGYQCQFTGADGTQCTARTGLEIEHDRPFAIHHSHDERFLSVLCASCRFRHSAHRTITCERSRPTKPGMSRPRCDAQASGAWARDRALAPARNRRHGAKNAPGATVKACGCYRNWGTCFRRLSQIPTEKGLATAGRPPRSYALPGGVRFLYAWNHAFPLSRHGPVLGDLRHMGGFSAPIPRCRCRVSSGSSSSRIRRTDERVLPARQHCWR